MNACCLSHLIQHRAEAEDVERASTFSLRLLGRHVETVRQSSLLPSAVAREVGRRRSPKPQSVSQTSPILSPGRRRHHHIGRFQVAMDDAR